jgi:hypothetical protein
MNEITVTIPLSMLAGAESLSAEGISTLLADVQNVRAAQRQAEDRLQIHAREVKQIGFELQAAVDADMNIMDKFTVIRSLANKIQQLGML